MFGETKKKLEEKFLENLAYVIGDSESLMLGSENIDILDGGKK